MGQCNSLVLVWLATSKAGLGFKNKKFCRKVTHKLPNNLRILGN